MVKSNYDLLSRKANGNTAYQFIQETHDLSRSREEKNEMKKKKKLKMPLINRQLSKAKQDCINCI